MGDYSEPTAERSESQASADGPGGLRAGDWRVFAIGVITVAAIVRLVFAGLIDLVPEEAYYWNYARHLDIGYLDHPPMVAWLIWLSTSVLGHTELAVRLPAYICWFVAAFFVFRLALRLVDRAAALRTVLLMAALPIYFSIGFLMTPDAPMYAAWAGCLYFLEGALVAGRRTAWWGVGVCLGLGLLSKYSILLLGFAAVTFMVIDRDARRWWLRPQPYLAALIAAVIFSPVLVWNAQHDWASFFFQGPRRWSGEIAFSPHLLLGSALVLLTPLGLWAAIKALVSGQEQKVASPRHRLFVLAFTLAPLLVFFVNSLRSEPKLNWTGPVWLAALPLVALGMPGRKKPATVSNLSLWSRYWVITIGALLVLYTGGLGYIYAGLPGIRPPEEMPLPVAWKEFGEKTDAIEHRVRDETGSPPLPVGMDRYWVASELSFYDGGRDEPIREVGGRHLMGGGSLMWEFWLPRSTAIGRNLILIDLERRSLEREAIRQYFERVGDIREETIEKHGRVVGHFYWRLGYNYHD